MEEIKFYNLCAFVGEIVECGYSREVSLNIMKIQFDLSDKQIIEISNIFDEIVKKFEDGVFTVMDEEYGEFVSNYLENIIEIA